MNIIESLNWRSSIKKFDTSKKVSQQDLDQLLEAANLAATSGGFQPFKVVAISNEELKNKLVEHSYGQPQVGESSHLLVFAIETNIDVHIVDEYIERAAAIRNQKVEDMQQYKEGMSMFIQGMDVNTRQSWARSQAYIALGTVLAAAAELKIDTCPMEGFTPQKYDEILGLTEKGLTAAVILPIGYRSEEDYYSKMAKVRKSREEFVIELN